MAIVLGTNAGFVTVAPTNDPGGTTSGFAIADTNVMRDTTPSNAVKITEVGFWLDGASTDANFEMGIYAADGAVVPGEAGTLLHVDRTNSLGTSSGVWLRVTNLDWAIDSDTIYWIGMQTDNDAITSNFATSGLAGYDRLNAATLPNPFNGGAIRDSDAGWTFYAVVELEAPAGTHHQIISGDGLSWFTTEYFGAWLTISILFTVIGIITHIG